MIKFFYKLFNHDKIDDQQKTIDIYKERNEQLEAELREYKGYKLKYEVTKLYVEDDEALLELFELAEQKKSRAAELASMRLTHQAAALGIGSAYSQDGLLALQAAGGRKSYVQDGRSALKAAASEGIGLTSKADVLGRMGTVPLEAGFIRFAPHSPLMIPLCYGA